jgi:hypothetical protein
MDSDVVSAILAILNPIALKVKDAPHEGHLVLLAAEVFTSSV